MKSAIIKYLFIGVLLWLISASYGHYVAYTYAGRTRTPLPENKLDFISEAAEKIFPGKLNIKAKAAIIVDANSGDVLYAKNANSQLPIASLTKLATALVYLQYDPDLIDTITVMGEDYPSNRRTKLYKGEKLAANHCLHLCLMCSDNVAANALARSTGLSREEFVGKMNALARQLGMTKTTYVEPTGLDAGNMSSAADYIKLIDRAYNNKTISDISKKKSFQFKPINKKVTHTLYNTNRLLYSRWQIVGGKTGYISQSGYCLAVDAIDDDGQRIKAVILGAPSNGYRYRDANKLLAYACKG